MIRYFASVCKTIIKALSDEAAYQEATDEFKHYDAKCPRCGAKGKLSPYGSYERGLVHLVDVKMLDCRVKPLRFKCASCNTTHALLPDVLVPYSPYSLRFMLSVLLAYFERTMTVSKICEHFCIAISTLYVWKGKFLKHKDIMLGIITSLKKSAIDFLRELLGSSHISEYIQDFFRRYAFSFMQGQCAAAARSFPP